MCVPLEAARDGPPEDDDPADPCAEGVAADGGTEELALIPQVSQYPSGLIVPEQAGWSQLCGALTMHPWRQAWH